MALTTIFGINGVGKDSVANLLRETDDSLIVTSMSRLYMYILGIIDSIDSRTKVSEEQYKLLEQVPQEVMKKIDNEKLKPLLLDLAASDKNVIYISHLVSALRNGNEIIYLTDHLTPDWLISASKLIQIVAPSNLILERRLNDKARKRSSSLDEINYHQNLCNMEWERIEKSHLSNEMYIVENIDLYTCAEDVKKIITKKEEKNIGTREKIRRITYKE